MRVRTVLGLAALLCLAIACWVGPVSPTGSIASGIPVVTPSVSDIVAGVGKSLGSVRAIKRGLHVQPPHGKTGSGKVHQSLYTQYQLQTRAREKASVGFVDRSVLHINERTNLVLQS